MAGMGVYAAEMTLLSLCSDPEVMYDSSSWIGVAIVFCSLLAKNTAALQKLSIHSSLVPVSCRRNSTAMYRENTYRLCVKCCWTSTNLNMSTMRIFELLS